MVSVKLMRIDGDNNINKQTIELADKSIFGRGQILVSIATFPPVGTV